MILYSPVVNQKLKTNFFLYCKLSGFIFMCYENLTIHIYFRNYFSIYSFIFRDYNTHASLSGIQYIQFGYSFQR